MIVDAVPAFQREMSRFDFMERTEVHFIKDHHIKEHALLFQNTWDASFVIGPYTRCNPSQ
jgi:hypothetical protein